MNSLSPFSRDQIMQAVKLRGQVQLEIKRNIKFAYTIAKSIKHPWYKCQALATVADHSNSNEMVSILKESFDSALACHDENRRVSVGCTSLQVALKHNLMDLTKVFLSKLIFQINQDMDPLSKWCAVDVLYTIRMRPTMLDEYFSTFVNATEKGYGWQVKRHIKYLLLDEEIKKNKKYVEYLSARLEKILNWEKNLELQK